MTCSNANVSLLVAVGIFYLLTAIMWIVASTKEAEIKPDSTEDDHKMIGELRTAANALFLVGGVFLLFIGWSNCYMAPASGRGGSSEGRVLA